MNRPTHWAIAVGAVAVAAVCTVIFWADAEPERTVERERFREKIVLRPLFDADLENFGGTLWSDPQSAGEGRVSLVSSVGEGQVRSGSKAVRFEVRPGDTNIAGSGDGERAEVFLGAKATAATKEQTQWWAWSTYFPNDFDSPGGEFNVFTQFHHSGPTGQANVHFDVRDRETIGLRVLGGRLDAPIRRDWALARLQRGRWYDFVFHVRWSDRKDGFIEVFVNGDLVVPKTHTPTLYANQSVYLKQGFYRGAYERPTIIFHDGTRRLTLGGKEKYYGPTLTLRR